MSILLVEQNVRAAASHGQTVAAWSAGDGRAPQLSPRPSVSDTGTVGSWSNGFQAAKLARYRPHRRKRRSRRPLERSRKIRGSAGV